MSHVIEGVRLDVLPLHLRSADCCENARVVGEEGRRPSDVTDVVAPAEERLANAIDQRLVLNGIRRRLGTPTLLRVRDVVGQLLRRALRFGHLESRCPFRGSGVHIADV
jgi:hypothetical protein